MAEFILIYMTVSILISMYDYIYPDICDYIS